MFPAWQADSLQLSRLGSPIKCESEVSSDSAIPWTAAHQAPPSMEFSRQKYWSGLPFPSLGDLPDLGIKPRLVKNPPAIQETLVQFLGREDPLEKG